jgi:hypothetical protein
VQSSKVEEKKKGKQHYAYLRSFGRREEFLICDDFFFSVTSDIVVCEGWFWTPSQITTSQARL